VLKARDGDWPDKEEHLDWTKHALSVRAMQVAGTHLDMLKGSNGRALARSIKNAFFS
jgi:thioesterase domain-containing protein